jgi:hypothetical protein
VLQKGIPRALAAAKFVVFLLAFMVAPLHPGPVTVSTVPERVVASVIAAHPIPYGAAM